MHRLTKNTERKPIGLGEISYKDISTKSYYVDKTLMIKDIIDSNVKVSLFTRPRRFGKTINMSMLRVFFEKNESEDTSIYFKDKKIWDAGEKYQTHQGKYPVIYLSFVGIEAPTFEEIKNDISGLIENEFTRHQDILDSPVLTDIEKKKYNGFIKGEEDESSLKKSIVFLSYILKKVYQMPVIIIIDEYDTPIHSGFYNGYYEDIIKFMRPFLSSTLKFNEDFIYGFLTGILRISKESIFSGLNNVVVYDVLNNYFSSYFGFTEEEVESMCKYYGFEDKIKEVNEWFDGYTFGQTKMYNPWSVSYYVYDCLGGMFTPKPYWADTSSNEIIGKLLFSNNDKRISDLNDLISGQSVESTINKDITFNNIDEKVDNLYSFLLMTGYLTAEKEVDGHLFYKLRIPNKEIKSVFGSQILSRVLHLGNGFNTSLGLAFERGDIDKIRKIIGDILKDSASYFDFTREESYQTFLLGLLALCNPKYNLRSNRESGFGRYDLVLKPKSKKVPLIIIEIKATKDDKKNLDALSKDALKQINKKKYGSEYPSSKGIIKYGVAFRGKDVSIKEEFEYEK